METKYDENQVVGILGSQPIPKVALSNEDELSHEVAVFLLFIHEVNTGAIG